MVGQSIRRCRPELQQGSVLLLDESANEKAGDKLVVGAGRQAVQWLTG